MGIKGQINSNILYPPRRTMKDVKSKWFWFNLVLMGLCVSHRRTAYQTNKELQYLLLMSGTECCSFGSQIDPNTHSVTEYEWFKGNDDTSWLAHSLFNEVMDEKAKTKMNRQEI